MDGEPLMDSESTGGVKKALESIPALADVVADLFKAPTVADLDRRLGHRAGPRK
jgi:hypothetical protein